MSSKTINICNKPDHLYIRFYCKKCKDFHLKTSKKGQDHKEFKLNRYYCPICNHTHISSVGIIFLEHLEKKGKEISYFSSACSLICSYREYRNITLSKKDAFEMDKIRKERRSFSKQELKRERDNLLKKEIRILLKYYIEDLEIPFTFYYRDNLYKWRFEKNNFGENGDLKEIIIINKVREARVKLLIYKIIFKNYFGLIKKRKSELTKIYNFLIKEIEKYKAKLEYYSQNKRRFHIEIKNRICYICSNEILQDDNYSIEHPKSMDLFSMDFSPKHYHRNCISLLIGK